MTWKPSRVPVPNSSRTAPTTVGHSESLKAPHQDAVGDDQADVYAELNAHVVGEGLEHHADDGHECGHDDKLDDDADAVGDGLANEGYDEVAESRNDRYGESHHDGGLELRGHGQRGADAEHLNQDGVVQAQRLRECLFEFCVHTYCLLKNAV